MSYLTMHFWNDSQIYGQLLMNLHKNKQYVRFLFLYYSSPASTRNLQKLMIIHTSNLLVITSSSFSEHIFSKSYISLSRPLSQGFTMIFGMMFFIGVLILSFMTKIVEYKGKVVFLHSLFVNTKSNETYENVGKSSWISNEGISL